MNDSIFTRRATHDDLGELLKLLQAAAAEVNDAATFDLQKATKHLEQKLEGEVIVVQQGDRLIGAITLSKIDYGYRMANGYETSHTFILPEARNFRVMRLLFDAVERFADRERVAVCFHQLRYQSALSDEPVNDERFDSLYMFRGYIEAGESYVRQPYIKVGRTYLYDPARPRKRRRRRSITRDEPDDGGSA